MNDSDKHKETGKMNQQVAGPKTNASVFLFIPTAQFFKTILASCTLAHMQADQQTQACKRANSANALITNFVL